MNKYLYDQEIEIYQEQEAIIDKSLFKTRIDPSKVNF